MAGRLKELFNKISEYLDGTYPDNTDDIDIAEHRSIIEGCSSHNVPLFFKTTGIYKNLIVLEILFNRTQKTISIVIVGCYHNFIKHDIIRQAFIGMVERGVNIEIIFTGDSININPTLKKYFLDNLSSINVYVLNNTQIFDHIQDNKHPINFCVSDNISYFCEYDPERHISYCNFDSPITAEFEEMFNNLKLDAKQII